MRIFRRSRTTTFDAITAQLVDIPWPAADQHTGSTTTEDGRPVLVAVSGTGSWDALDWAVSEAAARRCALRILSVVGCSLSFDIYGVAPVSGHTSALDTADSVLRAAARRAHSIVPELTITTQLRHGEAGAAILDEGDAAALIVLGRQRRRHRLRPHRHSVAERIARRSNSPTAIIQLRHQPVGDPSVGRVVVVVANDRDPSAALNFAFRAAARRRLGVTVLHGPAVTDSPVVAADTASPDAALDSAVRACRRAYPAVDLRLPSSVEPVAGALATESESAALVVIRSARDRRRQAAFGWPVGASVLRSIQCPIAIVPVPRRSSDR